MVFDAFLEESRKLRQILNDFKHSMDAFHQTLRELLEEMKKLREEMRHFRTKS